jgi:multiple sugar transport system permease protein
MSMVTYRGKRDLSVRAVLTYLVLLFGAVLSIFPFYWLIAGSLKTPSELLRRPPSLLPGHLTLDAYRFVWETMDVPRAFMNSTVVSGLEVGLNICFSALVAYALAKMRIPGKRYLMWLVLGLMMIPFQIMMIPLFLQINRLGLLDSYAGIILPGAVSSFTIFLLHQAFSTIPNDYIDAALVDGANHLSIMTRIAVPMILPLILTTVVINFLWSWNGFLWPYIVIQNDAMATLPVALARYQGFQAQRWDAVLAGATITSLPVLILYLIFQRKFVDSLTMTGLKG